MVRKILCFKTVDGFAKLSKTFVIIGHQQVVITRAIAGGRKNNIKPSTIMADLGTYLQTVETEHRADGYDGEKHEQCKRRKLVDAENAERTGNDYRCGVAANHRHQQPIDQVPRNLPRCGLN